MDGWAASKQIDGLGGEWTYQQFAFRALNFHSRSRHPIFYYQCESLDVLFTGAALSAWSIQWLGALSPSTFTVTLTFEAFPSIYDAVEGQVPMPSEGELSVGLHSVRILGPADDNRSLIFQHGWSTWSERGIGHLSRAYLEAHTRSAMFSHPTAVGPTPGTLPQLFESSSAADWMRLWSAYRPSGSCSASGLPGFRFTWHEVFGLVGDAPGEFISLTDSMGTRVATCSFLMQGDEAFVQDFFVWPPYRRKGYGKALETFLRTRGGLRGATTVYSPAWEGDCVRGQATAEAALAAVGYSIEQHEGCECPVLGTRSI